MNDSFFDLYTIMAHQIGDEQKKHPEFTTSKFRKKDGGWVTRCIDYIFVAKNEYLRTYGCLIEEFLDPEDIELNKEVGYPCHNHPSDHFAIGYKI